MPDSKKDPVRVRTGRQGGLTAAANADARDERDERMAHVRENSPASETYWARKLGFTFTTTADLTKGQLRKVATAKGLYFANLRQASVKAIKHKKAERLRRLAAAIDAEADAYTCEADEASA